MELVADPGIFNVIFVPKLIDNTLADIAEGSDVVEKDFHQDHAFPRLSFMFFYAFKWLQFSCWAIARETKGRNVPDRLP